MPYALGYWIEKRLVAVAAITGKRFAIRAIRVKIFWANSVYNSAIEKNWVWATCADRGGARADRGLLRRFAPRNPARSAFNVRRGNLPRRRRTSIAALWLYPLKNSRST